MRVTDRKPVPYYKLICSECGSIIEYKASEVRYCHITCPVCGMLLWAQTILPIKMEDENEVD